VTEPRQGGRRTQRVLRCCRKLPRDIGFRWLGGRVTSTDGWATGPAGGRSAAPARRPSADGGGRPGLGALWLLLAPLACCGGPLLIAGLASARALAWGGLGLGIAVLAAATAMLGFRRRRSRACGEPGAAGTVEEAGMAAARRPAARLPPRTPTRDRPGWLCPARPWLAVAREMASDRVG
jgi:hypothetical protein